MTMQANNSTHDDIKATPEDYLAEFRKRLDDLVTIRYDQIPHFITEDWQEPSLEHIKLANPIISVPRDWLLDEVQTDFSDLTMHLAPEVVQKHHDEFRQHIAELTKTIDDCIPHPIGPVSPVIPDAVLKPYRESAEAADRALTPEPGEKSLSEQMAKAAIPKLVEFAENLGNVTEAIITMKVKTDTGATAEMQQVFKIESPGTKPQVQESVIVLQPPESRPLGPHVRRLVKTVDWEKRTIVFKGRSHNRVTLPPDSDGAWNYMKQLLTTDDPEGWVELGGELDTRWQGHFTRTDARGEKNVKNPLTLLLCRIEPNRKRGRPSKAESQDVLSPILPKIRLTAFNNVKFAALTKKQKAAR